MKNGPLGTRYFNFFFEMSSTDKIDVEPENKKEIEKEDVWHIAYLGDEKWPFRNLNGPQTLFALLFGLFRLALILALFYVFIISLSMLGSGFLICGGTTAGLTFRNSDVFDNPFAACVIGILATVLVQSSSTSTSIIISMTAADLLKVNQAVFMVMGVNIGTSITNTLVAIGQINDKDQFRRAFGGATVHDMFNWLSVVVLLPIEWATGMLRGLAESSVKSLSIPEGYEAPNFLKVITKPATKGIISVDKKLIQKIGQEKNLTKLADLLQTPIIKWGKCEKESTKFMFCPADGQPPMADGSVGIILTIWAIILLSLTLISLVKVLNASLKGTTAKCLHKAINFELPSPFTCLTDWVLLTFGVGLTILAQSSSVTTSSLTPLVGIGLLSVEKMYSISLGANVGTTTTGILSAMGSGKLFTALTVAFCHLYFNVFGICIWFVVPYMRTIPIGIAKTLGDTTAEYRWFAAVYIFILFVFVPLIFLGMSLAGEIAFGVIMGPILILGVLYVIVRILRAHKPDILPPWLMEFYWLPVFLREEPACLQAYHEKMLTKATIREQKQAEDKEKNKDKLTIVDHIYIYSL